MLSASSVTDAAKIAPAAPVAVMNFLGYAIADWVSVVTLVYVLMLIAHFIVCKVVRPWRDWHGAHAEAGSDDVGD